jgi:hypothetical protein
MQWVGNSWVPDGVCPVCFQPECEGSSDGARPAAGALPSRLEPGEREYRGYDEWAVHPEEARVVLHRGYATVHGKQAAVSFIHNEAYVTQLRVRGSGEAPAAL